jgi:hypothetical protein
MVAYFEFEQMTPEGEAVRFAFKLISPSSIAEARAILAGQNNNRLHVKGTIIPRGVPYNPHWSFHLDPNSIGFFEYQMEVCDANVQYIEKNLDSVGRSTLPHCFWCPWSSLLVSEITDKIDPTTEIPLP